MLKVDKQEVLAVIMAQLAVAEEMVKCAKVDKTYIYAEGYKAATKKLLDEITKNF